jgi:hypothetical protein
MLESSTMNLGSRFIFQVLTLSIQAIISDFRCSLYLSCPIYGFRDRNHHFRLESHNSKLISRFRFQVLGVSMVLQKMGFGTETIYQV